MSVEEKTLARLSADEVKVITLMRRIQDPEADFLIMRREGKIRNVKATTQHAKEFEGEKLREIVT